MEDLLKTLFKPEYVLGLGLVFSSSSSFALMPYEPISSYSPSKIYEVLTCAFDNPYSGSGYRIEEDSEYEPRGRNQILDLENILYNGTFTPNEPVLIQNAVLDWMYDFYFCSRMGI